MAIFFQQVASWDFHLRMLALVVPAAAAGLVALWAATSKIHWFWRALAIWACVMLLLPVRAHEPALILALAMPLITAIAILVDWQLTPTQIPGRDVAKRRTIRFGTHDLLLLMLLVGLSLATGIHIHHRLTGFAWPDILLTSLSLAGAVILASAWVTGPWRRSRLLGLAVMVAVFAGAIPLLGRGSVEDVWYVLGVRYQPTLYWDDVATTGMALVELALVVALFASQAVVASRPETGSGVHRLARGSLAVCGLLVAVPLTWLYWQMLWLSPLPPRFAGPEENAFYDVVDLDPIAAASPPAAGPRRVQELGDKAVRLLDGPNFTPFEATVGLTEDSWNRFMKDQQMLRSLARTLDAEAAAAAARGDTDRAAELTVANLRLGAMLMRGNDVMGSVIGVAVQGLAQKRLATLRSDLAPAQARSAIEALQRIAAEGEPIEAVIARTDAYAQRTWGWPARLEFVLDRLLGLQYPYVEAHARATTSSLLLQTDLALRCFRHDHGRSPQSLEDLVPDYLSELPLDPYTQQPLRYRLAGDSFVLYSAGIDGHDDGGVFTNLPTYVRQDGYDFDIETLTRP